MSRDPDLDYDAWKCDDIEARAYHRIVPRVLPPELVAAEETRLAEARAVRVKPTPEERQARNEAGMDRLRAAAGLNLFRESRGR